MSEYNPLRALNFILGRIKNPARYAALDADISNLVSAAMDLDLAYMQSAGVVDEQGYMGDSYYDDEDAFEHIFESLCALLDIASQNEPLLADFVDEYMAAQQQYLEACGLVEWE